MPDENEKISKWSSDGRAVLNRQLPPTKTKTPMPTVKAVKKESSSEGKKS
ncbi:hypothetical protein [Nitrincola sp. A-D6]|nr:hypothetical protein [Nitrincola sp. A-D6]